MVSLLVLLFCLTLQPQAQKTAYLCDFALAADIVDAVGSDRLGLQYHSYHAQILQGDAVRVFNTYRSIIRHIQLADAPGEGAPGTGEIDFPGLFARIEATGYGGWVVADYRTEGRTDDSLGWLAPACL